LIRIFRRRAFPSDSFCEVHPMIPNPIKMNKRDLI